MHHRYALALGSNRRTRHGSPAATLRAAMAALDAAGITIEARSAIRATAPVGPAGRSFANAAVLVRTPLPPDALLACLKAVERAFGRRPGRRWGQRALDLDILLWSGGGWTRRGLTVPHPRLAERGFVLDPLREIAPEWQVPPGSLSVRHLRARLRRG